MNSTSTHSLNSNSTHDDLALSPVDFTWILVCGFLIFTMQTGFGLLEAGIVLQKNETNILLKNLADFILGGFSYWLFGYGITFGEWQGSSPFLGIGDYALDSPFSDHMGHIFTLFFFQLSFATTSATITSGGMAERVNFKAYCVYCFFSTVTYSVQARWVCTPTGFLTELGVIDIAGSGSVHLVGGSSALMAAWILGPRLGRYDFGPDPPPPGNPLNVLLGLFQLWFSWFAHNASSSHGVTDDKWKFGARAAMNTVVASIGGGLVGFMWGFLRPKKPLGVLDMVNSVMGSLVSITAGCSIFHTPAAFLTGVIGALVALIGNNVPDYFKIDDPVGASAVHGFGGIWGMLSVGLFAVDDGILGKGGTKSQGGLFMGGSVYLLGIQLLGVCCIVLWTFFSTFIILTLINFIIPLRVSEHEELLGMDFSEHGIRRDKIGLSPTLSVLGSLPDIQSMSSHIDMTGQDSLAHMKIIRALKDIRWQRRLRRQKNSVDSATPQLRKKTLALFDKIFNKLGQSSTFFKHSKSIHTGSTDRSRSMNWLRPKRNKIHDLV